MYNYVYVVVRMCLGFECALIRILCVILSVWEDTTLRLTYLPMFAPPHYSIAIPYPVFLQ